MQLNLRSSASKALAGIFCLLLAAAYTGIAAGDLLAYRLGASDEPQNIKRAIALEPGSAGYRNSLGQYFMFSEQRPELAIEQYQAAVKLNPHNAEFWLDLANGYSSIGAGEQQKMALERALEVDPNTPPVLREVANAFFMRGDLHEAAGMYRRLLESDPQEADATLQICWEGTHDLEVMSEVMPAMPEVHLAFLRLLMEEGKTAEAAETWSGLMATQKPFEPALAKPYLEYLIGQHDVQQARAAWENLGRMDARFRTHAAAGGNLVVNGGFEENILNMGFDWRYVAAPHDVLAVDTEQFEEGRRSLSITFDGEAVADTGLSQLIPVDENTSYHFSAYAKADELSAAHGPRFAIGDAYSNGQLFISEELLGTDGWKRVSGWFTTGANTKLVSLKIIRTAGAERIKGTLWIDDVAVTR